MIHKLFLAVFIFVLVSCGPHNAELLTGGSTKTWKIERLELVDPYGGPGAYLNQPHMDFYYQFSADEQLHVYGIFNEPTQVMVYRDTSFSMHSTWNFDGAGNLILPDYNDLLDHKAGRFFIESLNDHELVIESDSLRMEFSPA